MKNVIDLDTRKPCITELVRCTACEGEWAAVYPEGGNNRRLECPICHASKSEPAGVLPSRAAVLRAQQILHTRESNYSNNEVFELARELDRFVVENASAAR